MKFDNETEGTTFEVVQEKGYERVRVHEDLGTSPCTECGTETRFYSCALTAPLCSHECVDAAWQVYFENISLALAMEQRLVDEGASHEDAISETILFESGFTPKKPVIN